MPEKKPIKDIVKREDWQSLRKELKGNWSEKPEWCCNKLRTWMGAISDTSDEKLRIVMNYLVGTGFRTGRIKHKCISSIRGQISAELKKRKFKNG